MQNYNIVSIATALVGSAKLILSSFGIDIPNDTADGIVNGVAAIVTLVGVIKSHKKPVVG